LSHVTIHQSAHVICLPKNGRKMTAVVKTDWNSCRIILPADDWKQFHMHRDTPMSSIIINIHVLVVLQWKII